MKRRNKDGVSSLIMIAVAIVVVVIAAVVIIALARRARTTVNDTAATAFETIAEATNAIKNAYDNNTVTGSDVIAAINKYASATITVNVRTKMATADKAWAAAYADPGVASVDHINESAMFSSTVTTNANGEVTAINFTQK